MTIVFVNVGTAGKRTSSIAARISIEHKMAGPTKTNVQATVWTYILLTPEEGKKRVKGPSIFLKSMTRNLGNTPFPA